MDNPEKEIADLKDLVLKLTNRVKALEDVNNSGYSSGDYYVCNDDGTYNATNSKKLIIVNGKVTGVS
jgi:hypothetical protein